MKKLWSGQTRGGVLGHKIFVFIIKRFRLRVAFFVLHFVSAYFVFFSPKSTYSIYQFFRKVFQYSKLKSFLKIFRNYYIFGQTLIDKVAMMAGIVKQYTFEFDGEEHLRAMVENGTGGMLISAHVGNWEIAGHMLQRLNCKVNVVMYEAEHESLKKYMNSVTGKKYVNVIVMRSDMSHIFEISAALKNKELICIHGDRFVTGAKVIPTKFFGEKAFFPSGPFYMASKFDVPYAFVFAMKERSTHYHLYSTPQKKCTEGVQKMVEEYAAELEKMVLKYPEQWFNYYDFWTPVEKK